MLKFDEIEKNTKIIQIDKEEFCKESFIKKIRRLEQGKEEKILRRFAHNRS